MIFRVRTGRFTYLTLKKFTYHVVGLICSVAMSASAQQVRVMQWNVEGHIGNIASNSTAGAKAIARIVNYNQPDILLLNEIQSRTALGSGTTNLNGAALIDWVTNNVPYLGSQPGVTFFILLSSQSDFFIRNGAISRYPISGATTYDDGLRGLHTFKAQLSGTNALQIFHAHLKCCHDTSSSPTDCDRRQSEAQFDSDTIRAWAATNSLPYIFAGDWNEDQSNAQCDLIDTTYRPITMIRTNGNLVDFVPTALNGSSKTISSTSPTSRFDYCLAGSNRLSAVSGYVFNSSVWGSQYTSVIPGSSTSDSTTASDHLNVFVNYSFPVGATNFSVIPATAFASGGPAGGPFSPSSQVYTLTNSDTIPLFWSVTKTSNWLTVSPLATNLTLGAGRSTNITASINSAANLLTPGTYTDTINFSNTATGVSIPRDVTLIPEASPPTAIFTGSPTNGMGPLAVTFTDTSTGNISNRFWDFGDGGTTNITTNVVIHTYTSGTNVVATYDVTLVASGVGGAGTNTKPNYITVQASPSTIQGDAGNLFDRFGTAPANLAPTNSVAVLVVDTGNNGFVDLQPSFSLSMGATWGTDDKVVGLWDLNACLCGDGQLLDQTVVAYTNGIAPGQKLRLYWFPSLTLASNTLDVTYYGKYTDTNSPPLNGSNPWQMPVGGSSIILRFQTTSLGGSNPESAGEATFLTAEPLPAFESWQIQYFGSTNNPAAASGADPDGDGMSNTNEFLAGFNPTSSAASLRVIKIEKIGNDIKVTYLGANGDTTYSSGPASRTNVLELTTGVPPSGSFSNNFASAGQTNILSGGTGTGVITNMMDTGGATNPPARYYRIRVLP